MRILSDKGQSLRENKYVNEEFEYLVKKFKLVAY